jgi:hypothetical protein
MKNNNSNIVAYIRVESSNDFFLSEEMGELIFMLNFYKCINKTHKITENCLQSKRGRDLSVKFLNIWARVFNRKGF